MQFGPSTVIRCQDDQERDDLCNKRSYFLRVSPFQICFLLTSKCLYYFEARLHSLDFLEWRFGQKTIFAKCVLDI